MQVFMKNYPQHSSINKVNFAGYVAECRMAQQASRYFKKTTYEQTEKLEKMLLDKGILAAQGQKDFNTYKDLSTQIPLKNKAGALVEIARKYYPDSELITEFARTLEISNSLRVNIARGKKPIRKIDIIG